MTSKNKSSFVDEMFDAILELKNREECYKFFDDLCTAGEIHSMSQRLAVAKLLDKDISYSDIARATGASTATISRVKRSLAYGEDGYRLMIDRLTKNSSRR